VAARRCSRFAHGVEDGNLDLLAVRTVGLERLTATIRRLAGDDLRAVGNALRSVEGAGGAGDALEDDFGVFANEYGHVLLL
jgi:hypothetical protein